MTLGYPSREHPQNEQHPRHDWTVAEIEGRFAQPFLDLLLDAQRVHRLHFTPNTVQMSTLLSIKTGACPEDCAYCPQSVRYDTGLSREALMEVAAVKDSARARQGGRRHPLLHGRGLPLARRRVTWTSSAPWSRKCARWAWKAAPP